MSTDVLLSLSNALGVAISYLLGMDGGPLYGIHGTKNEYSTLLVPVADPFASRLAGLAVAGPRVPLWRLSPHTARREWPRMFERGAPLAHAAEGEAQGPPGHPRDAHARTWALWTR